ncbi:MAG TPA: hypothetical protein EYH56_01780 [Nanoarchaeota archaeon]|nr:hypothetical protein [Nanoarchaeota archaeon]
MIFDILGIAYDKSQSFRKGAKYFPELFWEILPKIETYQNGIELSEKAFFNNLGIIKPENFQDLIDKASKKLCECVNFPLILGGEHTITFACAKTLKERLKIKNIVILDAHPDCEDSQGHDSVVRKLFPVFKENIYLYGIRCMSKNEENFIEKYKIKLLSDISELENINGNVYLSIDFDVFDPSILPLVGNPEVNGIDVREFEKIIKILAPEIVAIDFVEFTPSGIKELDKIYLYLAVTIILKTIAEIIKAKS